MGSIATQVSIIEHISDMVYVNVLNRKLQYASFGHAMLNGDKKMIRKGNFGAPSAQLITNNLEQGNYQFQLMLNGQVWQTLSLRRSTDVFAIA